MHGRSSEGASVLCYAAALLYGVTHAALNTQLYEILGALYPNDGRVTFTLFQIAKQLGSIYGFASPNFIPLESSWIPLALQAGFTVSMFLSFTFVRIK